MSNVEKIQQVQQVLGDTEQSRLSIKSKKERSGKKIKVQKPEANRKIEHHTQKDGRQQQSDLERKSDPDNNQDEGRKNHIDIEV
jgi:hypothetical protein